MLRSSATELQRTMVSAQTARPLTLTAPTSRSPKSRSSLHLHWQARAQPSLVGGPGLGHLPPPLLLRPARHRADLRFLFPAFVVDVVLSVRNEIYTGPVCCELGQIRGRGALTGLLPLVTTAQRIRRVGREQARKDGEASNQGSQYLLLLSSDRMLILAPA